MSSDWRRMAADCRQAERGARRVRREKSGRSEHAALPGRGHHPLGDDHEAAARDVHHSPDRGRPGRSPCRVRRKRSWRAAWSSTTSVVGSFRAYGRALHRGAARARPADRPLPPPPPLAARAARGVLMPELPEVEWPRATCAGGLIGRRVRGVRADRRGGAHSAARRRPGPCARSRVRDSGRSTLGKNPLITLP